MSDIRQDILAPTLNKKKVIGVILVAGLLISIFTFSVYISSMIFGSQRVEPSNRLEEAEYESAELMLPPFPFDLEDLLDEWDVNLTELAEDLEIDEEILEELLEENLEETLQEMLDGEIDDLDLTKYGLAILALLFSEEEAFRVYDYDDPVEDRTDILWKYECFDEFQGDGWHSTVPKEVFDYYEYDDYYNLYAPLGMDLIRIKRELTPSAGTNSFVLGNLFSTPYLISESVEANYIDEELTMLYKDNLGCSLVDLTFDPGVEGNVSMYYDLFGEILPTNEEVNSSSVRVTSPSATYLDLLDTYLQLPPDIETYKSNNPYFNAHWVALDAIIDQSN
ncbi:MAG: hypothetical protein GF383_06000, partial [Candidatus Lokiarchaeota archaeon]|nr:hypothetical protein [Candidatus Lokiarchaeota archaeon]MBD3339495.1 hypothetical protein [Candidatus Lokiarchaeota archaeon]